ncbi:MAG TPA: DUF4276 family protein [Thermoanaerobaculia bacterium]
MTVLAIAPIVEGHGEVASVRKLIERTLETVAHSCVPFVLQPIRVPKSKIVQDVSELLRAVDLAALKLSSAPADRHTVLLLLDADDDAACVLGPSLLSAIQSERAHLDVTCVIAVVEYETWLVAGAETLGSCMVDGFATLIPTDPEAQRIGKGWIERLIAGPKYSETVDQVRLTARFCVSTARERSKSFDKFCRELEKRCLGTGHPAPP